MASELASVAFFRENLDIHTRAGRPSRLLVGIHITSRRLRVSKLAHPAEQKAIHSVHAIGDFVKNWAFEEICVFVAQKIAQDMTPLKIHPAQSNVAVW
ncbi:hypothetical protein BEL01nite_64000 [Bradyrhizobium elkanii]|nr:hypothetical protein BEL01nite_64000 [Bradyrhizobium elkanii]